METISPQQWTYVSGWVSAQAEQLMDHRELLGLLEADDADERASRLRSSVLFLDAPATDDLPDRVSDAFGAYVRRIGDASPDDRIADLFLAERDWEEFRAFAKARVIRSDETARDRGQEESSRFEACLREETEDPRMQPFADALAHIEAACPSEGDRAGWIDGVVDAHEAAMLMDLATALGSEALQDWVRTWTALRAGLSLIRARRIGWDASELLAQWRDAGFASEDLTVLAEGPDSAWALALERLGLPGAAAALAEDEPTVQLALRIDDGVARRAADASGIPFGPERVFAFLWAVRSEAINLRLLLNAAEYGIPETRVEAAMRTNYV